jgi:hypothetical protein
MSLIVQTEEKNENLLSKIDNMQKCVKALMQTKHYQALGEAGLFAMLQKAESLGMPQMEAVNGGLYVVNGKVGMSTEAMASMIRAKGHSIIKDPKSNDNVCILHGKRADNGDTWTCQFSIDDAKRAGLFKGVFEKYPSIMCYNRACSMLARQLFPDIIKGAGYTLEELHEIKDSKTYSQTIPVKSEPVEIEKISSEQAIELIAILDACDAEYQANVLNFIRKAPHSCVTLYDLPVSLYERLKTSSIKKKEEAEEEAINKFMAANQVVKPLDIEAKTEV